MAQPVRMDSILVKIFRCLWMLLIFATVSACQAHQASDSTAETAVRDTTASLATQSPPIATASTQAQAASPNSRADVRIPENFSEYASEALGNDERCVAGATTDEDGMNQKPVVYAVQGKHKQPSWVDQLELPSNTYQSRATHCASSGRALFVLLQSDTQPEQTLSQTLLHVVRMDPVTGAVQVQRDIQIPGASSAWVDAGPGHFHWTAGGLIVSGIERPQSSPDQQRHFVLRLDDDLNPMEKGQP